MYPDWGSRFRADNGLALLFPWRNGWQRCGLVRLVLRRIVDKFPLLDQVAVLIDLDPFAFVFAGYAGDPRSHHLASGAGCPRQPPGAWPCKRSPAAAGSSSRQPPVARLPPAAGSSRQPPWARSCEYAIDYLRRALRDSARGHSSRIVYLLLAGSKATVLGSRGRCRVCGNWTCISESIGLNAPGVSLRTHALLAGRHVWLIRLLLQRLAGEPLLPGNQREGWHPLGSLLPSGYRNWHSIELLILVLQRWICVLLAGKRIWLSCLRIDHGIGLPLLIRIVNVRRIGIRCLAWLRRLHASHGVKISRHLLARAGWRARKRHLPRCALDVALAESAAGRNVWLVVCIRAAERRAFGDERVLIFGLVRVLCARLLNEGIRQLAVHNVDETPLIGIRHWVFIPAAEETDVRCFFQIV